MPKINNIRGVPDAVHSKLTAQAGRYGESLSAYLLSELTMRLEESDDDVAHFRSSVKSKNAAKKKSQRRS